MAEARLPFMVLVIFNNKFYIMLNNLLKLEGVAVLSKDQQKSVNGGYSKLYCLYHSSDIVLRLQNGTEVLAIHRADFSYSDCRAMTD
jgi:hypothetical protein